MFSIESQALKSTTRLVAAMHVHGVTQILTYNTKDFARFPDIEVLHPADVVTSA